MSAETDKWIAWAKRHKVALGIGAAVLLLLSMYGGGEQPQPDPSIDGPPVAGDETTPGFDKKKWDQDQAQDDRTQENRIDTIRGVERCLVDGRVYEVETGNCPSN